MNLARNREACLACWYRAGGVLLVASDVPLGEAARGSVPTTSARGRMAQDRPPRCISALSSNVGARPGSASDLAFLYRAAADS